MEDGERSRILCGVGLYAVTSIFVEKREREREDVVCCCKNTNNNEDQKSYVLNQPLL